MSSARPQSTLPSPSPAPTDPASPADDPSEPTDPRDAVQADVADVPTGPQWGRKLPWLLISLAVLVLDQWTKWLVERHLPESVAQPVIDGFFNLTHVKNTGVAFGLLSEHGATGGAWLLALLGLLALGAVFVYFRLASPDHKTLLVSLSLIVGGALGNLVDRVAAGAVTDFVDLYVGTYHWPAFNVADSAITVGIVLMVIDSFRPHHYRDDEASASEDPIREDPADTAA